jgi:phosphoglycolate phosphatase-like HAD superfamily hydrolase
MRCYIFDLDGTLCDITHRLHHIQKEPKDWPAFFDACVDDKPIEHIVSLLDAFHELQEHIPGAPRVVFVSGRSDRVRQQTTEWLMEHLLLDDKPRLYMRKDGDHRPDHIVKLELLAHIRADGFEPIMAFDDRSSVVQAWRDAGIPCAQVAPGDF